MLRMSVWIAVLLLNVVSVSEAAPPDSWPAFRGTGDSHSAAKKLPVTWSATENIAWTAELPGYGQSSPVIVGNKVFVTSVEGDFKDTLHVLAFDLATGKQLWISTFKGTQRIRSTDYVSKAAPTPVATADRVFALFESGDLIALDHQGKEVWQRSLVKEYGPFGGNHGLGTSPVLAGDALVMAVAAGPGYVLAVDSKSGKNLWKTDAPLGTSWSTPFILTGKDGKWSAIVSSNGKVFAFDGKTGEVTWTVEGLSGNTVASPTPAGELLLIGASEKSSQVAIRTGAGIDDRIAWRSSGAVSSFGSPLIDGKYGYAVNRDGLAYCFDAATGAALWDTRLPASCWASPLAGAGHVYFFTRDGVCVVIKPGTELDVVAKNTLPIKGRVYGVAAVEGALVVRTGSGLTRIGK